MSEQLRSRIYRSLDVIPPGATFSDRSAAQHALTDVVMAAVQPRHALLDTIADHARVLVDALHDHHETADQYEALTIAVDQLDAYDAAHTAGLQVIP